MTRERQRGLVAGLILIVLGLAFFAGQYVQVPGWVFLSALGVIFLVVYLVQRAYGYLVPAGMLLGLGAGLALGGEGGRFGGGVIVGGLGVGFLAIYVIDRLYTRASTVWPLYPGGILALVGLLLVLAAQGLIPRDVLILLATWWPLGLVLIGAWLIFRQMGRRGGQGGMT